MNKKVSKKERELIEKEIMESIDNILKNHGFSDENRKKRMREVEYGLFSGYYNPESELNLECRK